MPDGIERLRAQRGKERVTFGEVCDHLRDFLRRSPERADLVDELAGFLAGVENVEHRHGEDRPATLDPETARNLPA